MWKGTRPLVGVCAAVIIVSLAGCGQSPSGPPVPPQPNVFEQQAMMMREALDMAKQAQQIQRDHMAMMERQMREADEGDDMGGFVGGGDSR